MNDLLFRAEGLGKTHRRGAEEVHALVDVSFSVSTGEMVALTGPSGSGKTTLLNVLAGWEDADVGKINWLGETIDPAAMRLRSWDEVAVAPQRLGLVEELTLEENVELPLRLGGAPDPPRVAELLELFMLEHLAPRLPAEVSLGEQQRTALARALIRRPLLLLADEPTGHQDAGFAEVVLGALRRLCETGTACVIATHNPEIVARCPRALRLRDGRLA